MTTRGRALIAAGLSAWMLAFVTATLEMSGEVSGEVSAGAQPPAPPAQNATDDDYGYAKGYLTDAQREGRDTWYFWTGGNEKFWIKMAELTEGNVNLLAYVDSRLHGRRFATLGAITQPGCRAATKPDQYGLWMDDCDQPAVPGVPGGPSGVVGLRRFPNPGFDPANWNAEEYFKHPGKMQPPYLIGMACGFCHVGFNPLNPPENPELPRWVNLAGAIGNQYWEEGRLFNLRMPPTDFRWHVGNRQPPGTSDTSRFATDHINNPNAINAVFNLAHRPTETEKMKDGSDRAVHHILKDGADSIGVAGASLRVYVNIGMCGDYWLTLHDPVMGRKPQSPFLIDTARKNCEDWRQTEARMENAESFLKTIRPMRLKEAPGGAGFLTADEEALRRGKMAFADKCARCHSSKQPPLEISTDRAKVEAWFRESVASADFLENNFLSDDRRYPVYQIGTNIARAAAHQRDGGPGMVGLLLGELQAAAGDRQDQRPLQPARSRGAARVGARRRGPRLLSDADADLDVGDGALPPQQRARDVREGSVGARPDAVVPRLDREAAVARAAPRRAVDHRHVDRHRPADPRPRSSAADSGRDAGRPDRTRRSAGGAVDRPEPPRPEHPVGSSALPRPDPEKPGAGLHPGSRAPVRHGAVGRRQAGVD